MYEVGIRMVAPRADVREVDAVVVARTDRSRAQVRDRPAEVWVTPFDEIFRAPEPDANPTTEHEDPVIPIQEVGRGAVQVSVRVAHGEPHSDEPGVEEQYIAPEAAAHAFTVTFDEAFHGAELRAKPTPPTARVEKREPEPEPEPVFETVAEVEEEPEPGPVGQELVVEPEPVFDTSTCNIAVWRGYRKAMFYAQSLDGDETVALAESPTFKYSGNGTPDQTEAAAQAYQALVELLREEGWRTVDEGPAWFEQTLTRS
jgi:hypothetical protein